jgi:hypothetical protein
MTTPNDGGPAYPISLPGWGDNGRGGMTLRDHFAAQVLPVLADRMIVEQHCCLFWPWLRLRRWFGGGFPRPKKWLDHYDKDAADWAYRYADAMIAARTPSPAATSEKT